MHSNTTLSSTSARSVAFYPASLAYHHNKGGLNSCSSSHSSSTSTVTHPKSDEKLRSSAKKSKKKQVLTKSHDRGLDSLISSPPATRPQLPLTFQLPVNDFDSDKDTTPTPTAVGCFSFRRNNSQLPLPAPPSSHYDKSPVHELKQSYSLGNSPAGRKKLSLDSRLSPLARRQQFSYISPEISPLVGENPFLKSCSQQGSRLMLINSNPDNPTYDRLFYKSMQKSLDEIFSTKPAQQTSTSANSSFQSNNYWQKSEPVSSKSSVNLTMYSSTSQLAEDFSEDEESSPYYRFHRNGSGSQFPRHCFFRQPPSTTVAQTHVHNEQQKNYSFSSHHSTEDRFNSMNSIESSSRDNSTNSQQTSRKSSMVTFHLNNINNNNNNNSSNNSSHLSSFDESVGGGGVSGSDNNSSSLHSNSFSFMTYCSDAENTSRHVNDDQFSTLFINENSIFATRKLQDVQPDPEVIKMKEQLLLQQTKQQQQMALKQAKQEEKTKKSKTKMQNTTTAANSQYISDSDGGSSNQNHSSSSAKFKSLMNFFNFGSLSRSKKKYQKSKSSYKLFENSQDLMNRDSSIRISPQRTKSCDQLETV